MLGTLATAAVTLVGLPLLWLPVVGRPWAGWHQRRAGRMRGVASPPDPPRRHRYLAWLPAHAVAGLPVGLLTLLCAGNLLTAMVVTPLWWAFPADNPARLVFEIPVRDWGTALALGAAQIGVLGAVVLLVLPLLAGGYARATLALLAPSPAERLADRVEVLTRTRADVLEAHGAELRRIERDLHDGTQARLVAIAMRLAVARDALPDDPALVDRLLREAHEGTEEAMTELRDVIRTMYPPILADRGLAGALRTVAARSGISTEVDVGELGTVPAAVEAVAYFAVTEALTNVAKHSAAGSAVVRAHRSGDRLCVVVGDDGTGGADEAAGTGLAGIRRRAEALDGVVTVASPPGGPTTLTVELPCG
ncbi:sensor histidine kinase [Actinoplanes sp. NEAU-A11]|uniref:histidine kinase n=1 Tax=Actinoplanes aureus TaxID=2792083 RepID=A0A931G0M6_9ACTN|nr:sensor histidine kinase [Actinoplanes aureus]